MLVSLGALLLAGCDSLPGRPTRADIPLRPDKVTSFARLYRENCAGCHGADGEFGAAIAMNNPIYLAIVSDAAMHYVIAEGVPGTA
ncbi:MAG: c-type cytochrome, partial [Candidatus Binatus sp.]